MNLIVAYCKNRGIGFKNTLTWKLSLDMNRFKKLTIGNKNNAVIMGRNTWESLTLKYKPLPKRTNIILTTKADYRLNTIDPNVPKFFSSFKSAEHYCSLAQIDNMWVIGGEMIYNELSNINRVRRGQSIQSTYTQLKTDPAVLGNKLEDKVLDLKLPNSKISGMKLKE